MKVELCKKVGGTDVMRQALIANAELIQCGATDGTWHPFTTESEALYIRDEAHQIVALMVFREEYETDIWISLAWVACHRRRQGLYRMMFAALEAEARTRKMKCIEGFVYSGNDPMRRTAESVGRKAIRTVYGLDLKYEEVPT